MQDHLGGAQDAGADAHQAHAAAGLEVFQQIELVAEIVEVDRHGAHAVAPGDLFHRLQEVPAGHHRAVAGALEDAFQLLHRHHLHRHIQMGRELFGDQHRGADVFAGGAHQHAGAAAQPPVDLAGEQVARLLQGAASVEQPVHALAHLAVDVRQVAAAGAGSRLDVARILLVAHIDAGARHGLDHAIVLQLPIHLADRVAVQAGLHRQLARAR